jgi:hypothetical protein
MEELMEWSLLLLQTQRGHAFDDDMTEMATQLENAHRT